MVDYGLDQRTHLGERLVAVLLLTRSRPGPRLVYHYPPSVDLQHNARKSGLTEDDTDSDSDDDASKIKHGAPKGHFASIANATDNLGGSRTDHESFLGHSVETLEKLLSPGRWCEGKRFEANIDGLSFIGHPIYAPENGIWNKDAKSSDRDDDVDIETHKSRHIPISAPDETSYGNSYVTDSLDSYIGPSLGTSMESRSTFSGVVADQITMFQVVFAIRATSKDSRSDISSIFEDIAKRLSRAMEHCQKEYNYVTLESRKLFALKSKSKHTNATGTDVWTQMTETSELAWSLQELYCQISSGGIANLRLHGMEMSLQLRSRQHEDHRSMTDNQQLSPLTALLLLEPKETILANLSHIDTSPLVSFIRELKPTKNLMKHATNLGLPIGEVLYLAHHLVKWRKARILKMPLHQRNTYVLNPAAPLTNLQEVIGRYERLFPTHLPSLPNMLRILGGTPIRYGMLPPSRDHRAIYMEILTFLAREGFVSQLLTQGWLCIAEDYGSHVLLESPEALEKPRILTAASLLSPHLRTATEDDDIASVSSDRTALPLGTHSSRPPTATSRLSKRLSSATQITVTHAGVSDPDQNVVPARTIIVSPADLHPEESILVSQIKNSFSSAEQKALFGVILPYLDGDHAFETIAAQTGSKRALVEECLEKLDEQGLLIKVKILDGLPAPCADV